MQVKEEDEAMIALEEAGWKDFLQQDSIVRLGLSNYLWSLKS